ncbi:MAG: ABC transporter ATP-binding protein [Actinomycetes bacterium]
MTAVTAPHSASAPGTATSLAIRTTGLTRRFGSHVAVDDVDLNVPRGAVYGFLGPNGSGKTTTIRLLLGLIAAHGGSIDVLGERLPGAAARVLPLVGTLVEGPAFHPYLSGRDNLRRLDSFDATADPQTQKARIDAALARVGLSSAAKKIFRRYSLGMKQRLGLAAALLQPRQLLILDEPTNGLDPQGTREVRNLVREVASDGMTVLVSSHLLAEVEQVATHVGIMSGGRLIRQGALADVLGETASVLRVVTSDVEHAAMVLGELGVAGIERHADGVSGQLGGLAPEAVNVALVQAGIPVRGLAVDRPALEEMYVELTGEGFNVLR